MLAGCVLLCLPACLAARQMAADGKLPKVPALLHVEAFHALAQNPQLAAKVRGGLLGHRANQGCINS